MEQWCNDCKGSKFYSEPLSSISRSPPIDLPLHLRRSGPNFSSCSTWLRAERGAPASPLLGRMVWGSAHSYHNHAMAGERSGHSSHCNGSAMGASVVASHWPPFQATSCFLRWSTSASPLSASQHRARVCAVIGQPHQPACYHSSPAT
jgi:hypothetical protein